MSIESIELISHSDWSKNPAKCWTAYAILQPDRHWQVYPLVQGIEVGTFFNFLKSRILGLGCILAGFDFPIGLPYQYAQKTGIGDFIDLLPRLGSGEWSEFYQPCSTPAEISLHRPFYPFRPGNSRHAHLECGLGISFSSLFRLCEVAHENRRAACPLFWTLGAQQVGKAALHAWQHLLSPALAQLELNLKIWPFSGSLNELSLPGNIVVVETYPAEFYTHLGILQPSDRMSKRSQAGRRFNAPRLMTLASELRLNLDHNLMALAGDGFGNHQYSEDCFDAFVGLYGMINVISAQHPTGEPVPQFASSIEGWIFGQEVRNRGI